MVDVTQVCSLCNGQKSYVQEKGESSVLIDPCPRCDGTGVMALFSINLDDIMDKLNDIKEKCDEIMEKLKE